MPVGDGTMAAKLRIRHAQYGTGTIFVLHRDAMNAFAAPLVRRACLLPLALAACTAMAQRGNESLTGDFGKLSAKERSRIAEREAQESAKDTIYQREMHNADLAFQQGRYEDALALFREARKLRPYNVYPKVKIEDLQALIKKKQEESAKQAQEAEPPAPSVSPQVPAAQQLAPAAPPVESPTPTAKPEPASTAPPSPPAEVRETKAATAPPTVPMPAKPLREAPAPRPEPVQDVPPARTTPAPTKAPEPKLAAPPGERIYKEAGAVVTERTLPDGDHTVTYKRVAHSWGQTFYFKDGLAIPAREWKERFNE